jgi:hypothetical protein
MEVTKTFPFPAEFVPPEEKETSEYGIMAATAINDRYVRGDLPQPINYANRWWYELMYRYATGNQPKEQYIAVYRGYGSLIGKDGTGTNGQGATSYQQPGLNEFDRKGLANINFDNIAIVPKLVSTLKALLDEADVMIDVNSVNPHAISQKNKIKWRTYWTSKLLKPLADEIGVLAPQMEWMPQTKAELELYERYHGFKLPFETGLELLLRHTYGISDWPILFDLTKDSAINTGFVCGRVCCNSEGAVEIVHIDPSDYITAFTEKQPTDEPPFAGHIYKVQLTTLIPKLRAMGASDKDIMELAQNNRSINGVSAGQAFDFNYVDPATARYLWEEWFVRVMYFEFRSNDEKRFRKYQKRDGSVKYTRVNPIKGKSGKYYYDENNTRNTIEEDVERSQMVYGGTWIIGSKWILDYGRLKNVMKNSDGSAALSFFHYHIKGDSIMERWKPIVDQYQLAWLKYQAEVLASKPTGVIADVGVLSNMDLGYGIMTPTQVLRVENETGNLFVSTSEALIKAGRGVKDVIQHKPGGPNEAVGAWLQLMQAQVNNMRDVSGISAAVEASATSKGPELVGLMQGEMVATGNALYEYKRGLIEFKKMASRKAIAKARVLMEHDPKSREYYEGVLGKEYVNSIIEYKDMSLNQIGLEVRVAPTAERKAAIRQVAQAALSGGRNGTPAIDFDDYLFLEKQLEDGHLELAAWYFSLAKKRREEKDAQIAAQQSEMNAQVQMQSAQAAEQAKRETAALIEQLKGENNLSVEERKGMLESALSRQKHLETMEQLRLEGQLEMQKSAATGKTIEISGQL